MQRTFLDANALLELILRRGKETDVQRLLEHTEQMFAISFLSVHLCYHFCLQARVPFVVIRDFLAGFEVVAMGSQTIELAQERYDGNDFEDCLQAACAEAAGCDQIVTLDKRFKQHSGTKLPVMVL